MADIKIYGTLVNATESNVIANGNQVFYKNRGKVNENGEAVKDGNGNVIEESVDVKTALDELYNKIDEIDNGGSGDISTDSEFYRGRITVADLLKLKTTETTDPESGEVIPAEVGENDLYLVYKEKTAEGKWSDASWKFDDDNDDEEAKSAGTFVQYIDGKWDVVVCAQPTKTLTPTVTIGGVTKDVEIVDKTALEILKQILCPHVDPSVTCTAGTTIMLYGKEYSLKLTSTAKKGSEEISEFKIDGTSQELTSADKKAASISKTKTITITPSDSSVKSASYKASVTDSTGVTKESGAAVVKYTPGIFFLTSPTADYFEDMSSVLLDVNDTVGCKGEIILDPSATDEAKKSVLFEKTLDEHSFLYVVLPGNLQIQSITSGGFVVPMKSLGSGVTLKQGTSLETAVEASFNVYIYDNNGARINPGDFECKVVVKGN